MAAWCRVELGGPEGTAPDVALVDALAQLQLAARRAGASVRVLVLCDDLAELLDFVGLRREVCGQAERGEEIGVEERVEPDDPVA